MKMVSKFAMGFAVLMFASMSFASPKCSHRVASSSNDLLKNTNPVRATVAKASLPQSGKESSRHGVK